LLISLPYKVPGLAGRCAMVPLLVVPIEYECVLQWTMHTA
jgi:hypothetical protein